MPKVRYVLASEHVNIMGDNYSKFATSQIKMAFLAQASINRKERKKIKGRL